MSERATTGGTASTTDVARAELDLLVAEIEPSRPLARRR